MFYFSIILLQILFSFFLFIYFNKKINRELAGEKIKSELGDLIISFNEFAERNITILEDRKNSYIKELEKIEVKIANLKKKSFYDSSPVTVPTVKGSKRIRKGGSLKKISSSKSKNSIKVETPFNIKSYFDNQKSENFDSMDVLSKIIFLKSKKMSDNMIAKKLKMSISEFKLILAKKEK